MRHKNSVNSDSIFPHRDRPMPAPNSALSYEFRFIAYAPLAALTRDLQGVVILCIAHKIRAIREVSMKD